MMTAYDLTREEKTFLQKPLIGRVVLFFVGILPIMVFSFYLLFLVVLSFLDGSQDMFSYLFPVFFLLFYLAAGKFIIPQYSNLFKYSNTRYKQIIETTVLDIQCTHMRGIPFFYIKTDSGIEINTKKNVIFFMDVPALEIVQGMKIYIHIIPGLKNEFLRISSAKVISAKQSLSDI